MADILWSFPFQERVANFIVNFEATSRFAYAATRRVARLRYGAFVRKLSASEFLAMIVVADEIKTCLHLFTFLNSIGVICCERTGSENRICKERDKTNKEEERQGFPCRRIHDKFLWTITH